MASGRQRQTWFIPGTRFSHVEETSGSPQSPSSVADDNVYNTCLIENKAAFEFSEYGMNDMLEEDVQELEAMSEEFACEPAPAAPPAESDEVIYARCVSVVQAERKATTTLLQRRLSIGYGRAARMMDMLEQRSIISPPMGAERRREILVEPPQ